MNITSALLYYLVILPISVLPFFILYRLSEFLYFMFYYVFGYRKKVIMGNIQRSFPNKSEAEQKQICKLFYKHFSDLIVESIKTFTISQKEVQKRVVCNNPELVDKYFEQNKSVIVTGGHYNNWEMLGVGIDMPLKHHVAGIYKPLTNKYFDKKMLQTRSRYGLEMVATKKVKQFFEDNKNKPFAIIFAVDQSPSNPESCYWTNFLNQETGVLFGAEKYAKEYNLPVLYGRINKVKRGHYSVDFFEVTNTPLETAHGEITEKFTRMLEKDINDIPQYWLWSHKRWKHKKPDKILTPSQVELKKRFNSNG